MPIINGALGPIDHWSPPPRESNNGPTSKRKAGPGEERSTQNTTSEKAKEMQARGSEEEKRRGFSDSNNRPTNKLKAGPGEERSTQSTTSDKTEDTLARGSEEEKWRGFFCAGADKYWSNTMDLVRREELSERDWEIINQSHYLTPDQVTGRETDFRWQVIANMWSHFDLRSLDEVRYPVKELDTDEGCRARRHRFDDDVGVIASFEMDEMEGKFRPPPGKRYAVTGRKGVWDLGHSMGPFYNEQRYREKVVNSFKGMSPTEVYGAGVSLINRYEQIIIASQGGPQKSAWYYCREHGHDPPRPRTTPKSPVQAHESKRRRVEGHPPNIVVPPPPPPPSQPNKPSNIVVPPPPPSQPKKPVPKPVLREERHVSVESADIDHLIDVDPVPLTPRSAPIMGASVGGGTYDASRDPRIRAPVDK